MVPRTVPSSADVKKMILAINDVELDGSFLTGVKWAAAWDRVQDRVPAGTGRNVSVQSGCIKGSGPRKRETPPSSNTSSFAVTANKVPEEGNLVVQCSVKI